MADRTYRAPPPGALRIESLGELTAIFDRRSMQTHLVVSPMPEILEAMGCDAYSAATLTARLAATFELGSEAEAEPVISARLAELAAMGLAERA